MGSKLAIKHLSSILGVDENLLIDLDEKMAGVPGKSGVLDSVFQKNEEMCKAAAEKLNAGQGDANHIRGILRQAVVKHEKTLIDFLKTIPDHDEFGRMAILAKKMVEMPEGYFLKKEHIKDILLKRQPKNLMSYLGYDSIEKLVEKEDLTECFSALRFVETNEWMHETFEKVYSGFTPDDFEKRPIELKVLGPKWLDISNKFVAKKHHNVSHLKEFGVIFLNPVQQNLPGKLLRDFALLLHYFHEIRFYSKLFQKYFPLPDFAERFKSLLRGDVNEVSARGGSASGGKTGEWLIVQRYLWKEDRDDPRLRLPRVNPESLHWARGERDLANYFSQSECKDLEIWGGLDWVGDLFPGERGEELVSFDLEDNAMSLVSFMEGREEFFTYHQREALWTKIFGEYVGGEETMEKLLLENFDKGIIKF